MRKKCDLVMKGGITSGIVYPRAVCELAEEFEFANIGGASAGAIAAALAAAAEVRRKNGSDEGFTELAKVPDWLGEKVNGRSRLLQLFQPSEETKPFYELMTRWLEMTGSTAAKAFATLRVLLRHFNRYGGAALAGIAVAAIVILGALRLWDDSRVLALGTIVGALLIAVVALAGFVIASAVEMLVALFRILPQQKFGVCSGATARGSTIDGLTDWLAKKIDETAGGEGPLTFGQLRAAGVNLEMMTTNVTHGQPMRLPWETKRFSFDPEELRALFPKNVVDWMEAHSIPLEQEPKLRMLPLADDLPVVFATRMSMSFPVLLAAIPLHAIDFGRRDGVKAPERCWFSDGGIGSNFPVHFFDAPLPRWPTFAINLATWSKRYHKEGQTVYAPRSNKGGLQAWWRPIGSLPAFLYQIVDTMQNWRDNSLLRMPGYRDRIAHVLLQQNEGGLNLTMDEDMIDAMAARGTEAARALRQRFGDQLPRADDVDLTWANHRWVRFRAFMSAAESVFDKYARGFDEGGYDALFDDPPSYAPRVPVRAVMRARALAFMQHIGQNFGGTTFRDLPNPHPFSKVRTMPED